MTDAAFLNQVFPPKLAWGQTYSRVIVYRGRFMALTNDDFIAGEGRVQGASERLLQAVMVLIQ
ncbi:MAG: hypothetical protein QM523_01020 [Candidatus Pacebacteria bacterium]|nr:hypothetical protein [Candidatus Paceibacterota bacterium]